MLSPSTFSLSFDLSGEYPEYVAHFVSRKEFDNYIEKERHACINEQTALAASFGSSRKVSKLLLDEARWNFYTIYMITAKSKESQVQ